MNFNNLKNTTLRYAVAVFFTFIFIGLSANAVGPQMSYHGRIVDSLTNLGVTGNVDFKIQVKTPTTAGDTCIMYEETQTKNLSNGVFVLGINNGVGVRVDGGAYNLQQIFSNKNTFGAFALPAGVCASSTPYSYSPTATDTRRVTIQFHDTSMAPGQWETLPSQTVAYVPSAIESLNVGGFPVDALVRVVDAGGNPAILSPLSIAQYTELTNLIGGTSTQYLLATNPAIGFTGSLAGDITGTQGVTVVSRIRGTSVSALAPVAGEVLKFNGTVWSPGVDNDSLGTVTNVSSANAYLTVTNPTLTPILTLNVGTVANTVAAGNDPRLVNAVLAGSAASGDLTGTYPSPTVSTVGGKTAAQIATSVNDTNAATASATSGTIVKRDGSGNSSFATAQATNFSGRNLYLFDSINTNSIRMMAPATFAGNYTLTLPVDAGPAGYILRTDGTGVLSWVNPTAGAVTSVTASAPITSSGGQTPNISLAKSSGTVDGYLASSDWTTFNNKLSTNLATGQVWVGFAGVANAQFLNIANIKSTVAGNFFTATGACAPGQTLTYSSVNDNVACAAYAITSAQVTTALGYTPATNLLPNGQIFVGNALNVATAVFASGDVSISNDGTITILNSAITNSKIANLAITNSKINDVNWNKISSTPTSIFGYGITDAILTNAGGVTSMQAGFNASKPAPGSAGRMYVSTDSAEIYRDNGSAWIKVGSAIGLGGTVTSVSAAMPISVLNNTSTPIISMLQASNLNDGYITSGDWSIFNAKQSTALINGQMWIGDVTNNAAPVTMSGDATISNAGVLAFNTVAGAPGTFPKVTFNNKGLVTAGSALSSTDVTTGLGYTPSSNALNAGLVFVGNSSNVAQGQALSGDIASVSNVGIVTFT
ncbi:MAG: hypothetical protein H7061_08150, partial [Bdellovibrionaceae bacterium]|nr:hypothetical protein [Bdellovibrio sp.]